MIDNNGNSGAAIEFDNVTSTGHHQNEFGNGDIGISMSRAGNRYKWLDLLRINFTQPTDDQFLNCKAAPSFTEASKQAIDMYRRLSFVQANYIKDILIKVLEEEFAGGVIPSDEEIKQILFNNSKQKPVLENASQENINEPIFLLNHLQWLELLNNSKQKDKEITHCVIVDTETFNWDEFKSCDDYDDSSTYVIRLAVRNGNGDVFQVGEEVYHQGASDTAIITEFILDPENGDIIAKTTKGTANVQFLLKNTNANR